ncbi:Wzy polymerase domain-containing protein [uncultured Marinobacter sp.]|uniref:PglL family O-oligosaccharyltransferase n=1 Tax=uncultured Marinobacter sp. TaxID=187379 RepID=UPI0030D9B3BD
MKYIIFLTLVFPPLVFAHFFPFTDFLEQFLTATLISIGVGTLLFAKSKRIVVPKLFLFWVMLGSLWLFVGALSDYARSSSWLWYLIVWVIGGAVFLIGGKLKETIGSERSSNLVAYSLLLTASLQVIIGLIQYYGVLELLFPWANYGSSRLSGTLGQPNLTAFSIAIGVASALYVFLNSEISRFSLCLILASFIFTIFLTGSRASAIYLFILLSMLGVNFFFGKKSKRPKIIFSIIALVGIVTVSYFSVPVVDRNVINILSQWGIGKELDDQRGQDRFSDFSSNERFCEWNKSFNTLLSGQASFSGEGLGSYARYSFKMDLQNAQKCKSKNMWDNPHNILISAFIEWGVFGFLFILGFIAYLFIFFFKLRKSSVWFFSSSIISMFFIYSMLEYPLWNLYFLTVFIFIITITDDFIVYNFSSRIFSFFIGVAFLLSFSMVSYNSVLSYTKITSIFNSKDVGSSEKTDLYSLGSNSLYGGAAIIVRYFRFLPEPYQISEQIAEARNVASWQPHPLVITRLALLSSMSSIHDACSYVWLLEEKYPRFVAVLNSDIELAKENGFSFFQSIDECPKRELKREEFFNL